MDVETSIAERLQKLRQWQVEQQERLLKQQQIQREILSHEQDRIYKVLGLSINDFDTIENKEDICVIHEIEMDTEETMSNKAPMLQCGARNFDGALKMIDKRISTNTDPSYKNYDNEEQSDDSDSISAIVENKNKNSMKDYNSGILSQEKELSDLLVEEIKPLSLDNVSKKHILIDDIPLPSPKKDFQTLLEEKLKKESETTPHMHTDVKNKPKKSFLKKGQGLSRFKMLTNLHPPTATTKRYNMSLASNTQYIDRNDKSKKSTIHRHVFPKTLDNVSIANEKQQLNLKTIPLPKKKIVSKSITPTNQTMYNVTSNQSKYLSEMNISDCDSKAEKELEEVRIFELLEEKAENSSFCSTSSTVLAFLQQSTPFKVKNKLNQARGESIIANKKQQNDEQTSNMIKQEPMIQQVAHTDNSKSSVQCQIEQFELYKHSHTNDATIDSYCDTITVDNIQEEIQNYFIPTNQVLQSNETYTDHPENHDMSIITVLSNSDGKRDISTGNDHNLTHDSEADASHHVRFSEYNEYRTIDLTDVSDMANNSPLKDYLEQQNWNNCFIDTLESSNIKENLSFNYQEQIHNSSLKTINNEKTVSTPKQLSLQQDITRHNKKDSYNSVIKTIHVFEEKNILSCKDETLNEDICYDKCTPIIKEIIQTSDEEQSILSSSLSSSSLSLLDIQGLNTHGREEYISRSEPEKIIEKIAKICSKDERNVRKIDLSSSENQMNQINTFEKELLKNRLLELEKEIEIFRKESSVLLFQRQKLQEAETILRKQYAEKEKNFEENKRRIRNQLEEEKKRVAREKIAMENRIRDAQEKARQNKMERQKAQNLQEQLEQLKDELNTKESRWNAAESRYKSELRVLRVEISKLKQEIANLQNIKKTNVKNLRKNTGQVITKAINQINKRIVIAPSKETSMKMCQDSLDTSPDTSAHDDDDENEDKNRNKSIMKPINVNNGFGQTEDEISVKKIKSKQVEIESQPKCKKFPEGNIVEKKRHLYENLLKDATSDLKNPFYIKQDMLSDSQPVVGDNTENTQIQNLNAKSNKSYSNSINEDFRYTTAYAANNIEYYNRLREINQDSDENGIKIEQEKKKDQILFQKNLRSTLHPSSLPNQINKTSMDTIKQIQFSDGRIEYWYPNGNVKKIFPDQEVTKMIYYNGDVRETDKNRKIKYFYATTRIWHTTTPDGLEILEFPEYVYFVTVLYYVCLFQFVVLFYFLNI